MSEHSRVVFLGPSLSVQKAERILDADYRPPVKRGDLENLDGPDTVVIIDGEFGGALSVSPKEILDAMDCGLRVIGAASMGALRAAELQAYGMIGVGWIFHRFREQSVRQEDDVALTFSPIDLAPLTIPMVNVEYWVHLLRDKGVIDQKDRKAILRCAKSLFFADRTQQALQNSLTKLLGDSRYDRLLAATGGTIPDIKALDAGRALDYVSGSDF